MNNYYIQLEEIILKYSRKIFKKDERTIIQQLKDMKKYKMIRKKGLMIWKINPEIKRELKSIFDVVCCLNIDYIDWSEFYYEKDKSIFIVYDNVYIINTFYSFDEESVKYLSIFDFRKCKSLERISISHNYKQMFKIEG